MSTQIHSSAPQPSRSATKHSNAGTRRLRASTRAMPNWRHALWTTTLCAIAGVLPSCNRGGSAAPPIGPNAPANPTPGANTEVVAVVRNMLANPYDPDPWLAQLAELSASLYDAGGDPTEVYLTLQTSYLAAIQTPEDVFAAQQTAKSASNVFTFGGASPSTGDQALASTSGDAGDSAVVYFVNGILTEPKSANDSTLLLKRLILKAYPELASTEFKTFYNRSGFASTSITSRVCGFLLDDLLPYFLRCSDPDRANDPLTPFICNASMMNLLTEWNRLRDVCVTIGGIGVDGVQALAQWLDQFRDSITLDAAFIAQTVQLAEKLQGDVASGHRVVVVCHSQGNFFTEAALNLLPQATRDGIGVISVASPTAFQNKGTYGFFRHHLLEQDAIRATQTSPPANRRNALSDEAAQNGCLAGFCLAGIGVHDLALSYLGYPESRDPIIQSVFEALEALRPGMQASALPSLANSSNGSLSLMSVSQLDTTDHLAVTWRSNSTAVQNVFLQPNETWSSVASVPLFGTLSPALPDNSGGVVLLGSGQYVSFSPQNATVAQSPTWALGWLSYGSSNSWFRANKPMLVIRGELGPNFLTSAEYESATNTWDLSFNTTGANIDTRGLVLPYGTSDFQNVQTKLVSIGQVELVSQFRDRQGVDLGNQILATSTDQILSVASASDLAGASILAVAEQTPQGTSLHIFEYTRLGGWSTGQLVATLPIGISTALSTTRVAMAPGGQALLAVSNDMATSVTVFSREAGSAMWQQATFSGGSRVRSLGISATGGFLVAAVSTGQTLALVGKRLGNDKPWQTASTATLDGALPLGYLGPVFIQPTMHGRFLVVADLLLFGSFTQEIAAALIRI